MSPDLPSRPQSPQTAADAQAPAAPAPVDWSEESTAGEEDPGASLDLGLDPPAGAPAAPAPADGGAAPPDKP
jgi:hypothetical protein